MFVRLQVRLRRLMARLRRSVSIKAIVTSSLIVLTPVPGFAQVIVPRPAVVIEAPIVRVPQPVIPVRPPQAGVFKAPTMQVPIPAPSAHISRNEKILDSDVVRMCGDIKDPRTIEAVVKIKMALERYASKVSKKANAEDASHEAITRLIHNCDKIISRYYKHPAAVALVVTRNIVYSEARAGWVVYGVNTDGSEVVEKLHDKAPTPAETLEAKDLVQKIEGKLTSREKEVMAGLADGQSTATIAKNLEVTDARVRQIRSNIKKKLVELSQVAQN